MLRRDVVLVIFLAVLLFVVVLAALFDVHLPAVRLHAAGVGGNVVARAFRAAGTLVAHFGARFGVFRCRRRLLGFLFLFGLTSHAVGHDFFGSVDVNVHLVFGESEIGFLAFRSGGFRRSLRALSC
eukprot:2882471-Pleurochrysis_carterae.AAC.1